LAAWRLERVGGKLYIYSGRPFLSSPTARSPGLLSATTGGTILADLLDPTILGIHCTA